MQPEVLPFLPKRPRQPDRSRHLPEKHPERRSSIDVTRADRILLTVLIAIALLAVPGAALAERGERHVRVTGPSGSTVIDATEDGIFSVDGRLGTVVIEVRDGTVRCVSADCPDQICVGSGVVRAGAPVICAPNGVIAELAGDVGEGAIDAITR
ncbi:MAG: hypothetical protein CVT60_06605 [Actinobacteria bacterium HGW-Actinobacteria-10]|nr:MAG: hypothetical protein CVT60_06605 [Actinobacteria bacterium HGW-Actinobacteria-10]